MTCRHCGVSLRRARPKSLALCRGCTVRGTALFRASVEGLDLSERQRQWNRWFGPTAEVLAALANDREAA